ncbi:MAG: 8-oxo-dGTP diphosphatase MutT [Myxococcota bacterium]
MLAVPVAAAVIRRDDNTVLLTQRQEGTHLAGRWEFPGGKLESGESPEDALVRECREECGIEVAVGDIVDVTYHRFPEIDVLLLFYDCRLLSGAVKHVQVADHAWVDAEGLAGYTFPPSDLRVVEKVRAMLRAGAPCALAVS